MDSDTTLEWINLAEEWLKGKPASADREDRALSTVPPAAQPIFAAAEKDQSSLEDDEGLVRIINAISDSWLSSPRIGPSGSETVRCNALWPCFRNSFAAVLSKIAVGPVGMLQRYVIKGNIKQCIIAFDDALRTITTVKNRQLGGWLIFHIRFRYHLCRSDTLS